MPSREKISKKNIIVLKIGSLFAAAFLLWVAVMTYYKVTDGFSLREITSFLPYREAYTVPPISQENREFLSKILDQEFRYIGKGCQVYVFESETGEYVIKLFKHKHLRSIAWLNLLPKPAILKHYCEEKVQKREERIDRLFSSCKLAYLELPEETGVMYVHLNKTPLFQKKVTLKDKLGFRHQIEIDDHEFIIQKKATRVGEYFDTLNDENRIRENVKKLVDLVSLRCQKGIQDRDRSFVQNVAFSKKDERAVFVDVGQFYKDETLKEASNLEREIIKRLQLFHAWSTLHAPTLLPYIEEEMKKREGR